VNGATGPVRRTCDCDPAIPDGCAIAIGAAIGSSFAAGATTSDVAGCRSAIGSPAVAWVRSVAASSRAVAASHRTQINRRIISSFPIGGLPNCWLP
jgi:hypothetical protein